MFVPVDESAKGWLLWPGSDQPAPILTCCGCFNHAHVKNPGAPGYISWPNPHLMLTMPYGDLTGSKSSFLVWENFDRHLENQLFRK